MSVIPQTYNQGTGFIGSANTGTQLPNDVDDLIVNNTLTVLGTSEFNGNVTMNNDLQVNGETTLNDVIVTGAVDFQQIEVDNLTVNNTLTSVQDTEIQGTIGAPGADNKFALPTNGPPSAGDVIKLDGNGGSTFEADTSVDDYVSFNTVTEQFVNNPPGGPAATITDATFDTVTTQNVGRAGVEFELPAAAPAANQILTALNTTQTEWADPVPAVQDYLTFNAAVGSDPQTLQQVTNNGAPSDTPSLQVITDLGTDTGFIKMGNSNSGINNNPVLEVNHTQPNTEETDMTIDQTGFSIRSFTSGNNSINMSLRTDGEFTLNTAGVGTAPFNFFMKVDGNTGDFLLGYPNTSVCRWPKNAPTTGDVLTVAGPATGSLADPFPLSWA